MTNHDRYPLLFDFCRKNFIDCNIDHSIDLIYFWFKNALSGDRYYYCCYGVRKRSFKCMDAYVLSKLKQSGIAELQKPIIDYIKEDQRLMNENRRPMFCYNNYNNMPKMSVNKFDIEKVVFNDPATIVFWKDGTKTVVKCQQGDIFDKEKGLAMAIAKRALGDKGNYNEILKKYLKG